ncbi:EAL domain-containing protein [Thiomicrorhabdus sp.]|uniref:bifunctional diguanylate cyclase/phosphodiesterase n=1 Tax=Thiomicrorhabdus sp. TaxID=2039724 RepID=UPI002AA5EE6A|nr:EAL domain-containing protein [Thiomicrorhabdus sp.]
MPLENIKGYLDRAPYAFFRWKNEPEWPVMHTSSMAVKLLGYSASEWMSGQKLYSEIIHPDDLSCVLDEVNGALMSNLSDFIHKPYRIKTNNNEWIWVKDSTHIVRDANGKVIEFYGFLEDISNFKKLESIAEKALVLNEQITFALDQSNLISRADQYGNFTYVNDNLLNLTGYTRSELLNKPHSILRHPDTPSSLFKELWETIKTGNTWKGRLKNQKKDGSSYYVEMTIVPLRNSSDNLLEYLAIRHEVTELMEKQADLEHAIHTSKLLEIPNRNALIRDIPSLKYPKLAMLDIDDFRQFNDYFGNEFGDLLLLEFVKSISSHLPKNALLYHFHADQFIIYCNKLSNESFTNEMKTLQKYLSSETYSVKGQEIMFNTTLAICFEPHDVILNKLEMTMSQAKKASLDMLQFSPKIDMVEQRANNLMWSDKLNRAIEEDRITPFYQPIMSLRNHQIYKHEALVRLIEPNKEVISPYLFLDVSKKTKKYHKISKRVVTKTFELFKKIDKEFSINISASDILNPAYVSHLHNHLAVFPYKHNITFEILESEEISDLDGVTAFIENLKTHGCKFALDDFGAGYANYSNILNLKPDYIKLDGSLIQGLASNEDTKDILETIVSFAQKKDIKTIAEFVSDEAIFKTVKQLGIDYAQGYYIGKPMSKPDYKPCFNLKN